FGPFILLPQKVFALAQIPTVLEIKENTTWTKDQSPYIMYTSIYIDPQATLSLEPGTVIKFAQGTGINVGGSLEAIGTSSDSIYFTSINDNSVGGVTSSIDPAAGDWNGITFSNNPISFILRNISIRYANTGLSINQSSGALQNCEIATSSAASTI